MNNNIIVNVDTDAILICKQTQDEWSEDEQNLFIQELNKQFPEKIKFEHDGYYEAVLILASKNYVLKEYGDDELKIKGSGLKDQKKEPAIKEMIDKIIKAFIYNQIQDISKIYESYINEIFNITDINRWCQKKTITEPIVRCKGYEKYDKDQLKALGIRSNETVLWEAIKDEEFIQLGDKFYIFPAILSSKLESKTYKNGKTKEKLILNYGNLQPKYWNGKNHDVEHLLKRIYETMKIFEAVLDLNSYKNYSLTKNYKELLDKYSQNGILNPSEG